MIFDARCAGCGRSGPVLCRTCRFALAAPPAMPTRGEVIAALPFAGRPREVVLGFKYGNRRELGHHLAGLLVNRLLAAGVRPADVDVVTWAPTSRRRRRRRGFDQAELVAHRVARQLGVPCDRLLERAGPDRPQTGRGRADRLHGPVFRASPRAAGRRVLVVDDVVTTGATLRSAAAVLRGAGATTVIRSALATTPAVVAQPGDRPLPLHRRPATRSTDRRPVVHGPRAA